MTSLLLRLVWRCGLSYSAGSVTDTAVSSRRFDIPPYVALLTEVLLFHRRVLFGRGFVFPWDFRYFHLPLATILSDALRRGQLPLWDPYTYCGRPVYANFQIQAFYPPTILAILIHNLLGNHQLLHVLEWQLVLHVFLGGVFTYHLLRRLGTSRTAAAGATVYQLGGFFASQVQHLGMVDAAAWLPGAWLAVMSLSEGFRWRRLAALAVCLAMTMLAGFPAMAAVACLSCLLFAAVLQVWRPGLGLTTAPSRLRPGMGAEELRALTSGAALVAAAIVWALGLAAIQLLPGAELRGLSIAKYRGDYMGKGEFALGAGLPPVALASLVSPNHSGIFDLSHYAGQWDPTFLYLYCGITGLSLALIAAALRRDRAAQAFTAMTVVMMLWMLGRFTPIGRFILAIAPPPARDVAYPDLAMAAFVLSIAVLAGLGADWIEKAQLGNAKLAGAPMWRYAVVALVAIDLIVAGSGRPMNTASIREEPGITADAFDGSRELVDQARSLAASSNPPLRVDTVDDSMSWASCSPLTRVPVPSGVDPMAPARVIQVRLAFCNAQRWESYAQITKLDSPVLDLMNIGYVFSRTSMSDAALAQGRFVKAAELPWRHAYRNTRVLPRFFLVHRVRSVRSLDEAARILRSTDFDPHMEAVVEGPVSLQPAPGAAAAESVTVIDYSPQHVVLEAEASADAWLASSETHYPGWQASIDGHAQPIYYTNVAFRGLAVPAGRHRIVFDFAPGVLWRGVAISAVAWGLILLACLRRQAAGKQNGNR